MSILEQAGWGQHFSKEKISYEERVMSLNKRINLLMTGQFLVIGANAQVIPTNIARYIRKSNALRIPYEFPETVNQKNLYSNTVPAKLAELEKLVSPQDSIVAARYDANQGIRHHTFLKTHIIEADLLSRIDDLELRVHDYVLSKETNCGTFWTIEGIPSLEKGKPQGHIAKCGHVHKSMRISCEGRTTSHATTPAMLSNTIPQNPAEEQ